MNKNKYRIISIDASEIERQSRKNKGSFGVKIPKYSEKTKKEFKKLYGNYLDWSLDCEYLQAVYKEEMGDDFSFDLDGFSFTKAIVNVKFKLSLKDDGKVELDTKKLREKLYNNGFYIEGEKYVRYKRSAGSSKNGKCLFIMQKLFDKMDNWSNCGLSSGGINLASWEAYKSLSLSSIKGKVTIPLDSILFIKDKCSTFEDRVMSIEESEDNDITCEEKEVYVENKIWDGESLIDESLFTGDFASKHMLLLRNKFFKSCAFKTRLQKWFRDNNIKDISALKKVGITLAKDVSQIKLVTTESSLKFLKFMSGGLTEENIQFWTSHVDSEFGVVKCDKRTKFFNGRMVQTSYQLINSIHLNEKDVEEFIKDNIDLLMKVGRQEEVLRYYFSNITNREKDLYEDDEDDDNTPIGKTYRSKIIFDLLSLNHKFVNTTLYDDFVKDVRMSIRDRYMHGRLLIHGTNAVLFGNGPELLLECIGKFDGNTSVLKQGEIRCLSFEEDEELLCSRSPHITMGNLYLVKNKTKEFIWDYFDLGKNVVCVNAIGENIMHRLNGCDYDSDTMLITNDSLLCKQVKENYDKFLVPYCGIKEESTKNIPLNELDQLTSINKIGDIVNLSQKLNSIIWDKINTGASINSVIGIYKDVCKLAVLSGIEIDKAKHAYTIETFKILDKIRKKYAKEEDKYSKAPLFFFDIVNKWDDHNRPHTSKELSEEENKRIKEEHKKKKNEVIDTKYDFYDTAMEHVFKLVPEKANFRIGKDKKKYPVNISSMFNNIETTTFEINSNKIDEIISNIKYYNKEINTCNKKISKSDCNSDEANIYYDETIRLINERNNYARKNIFNIALLKAVIEKLETNTGRDWLIYSAFMRIDNNLVQELFKSGEEHLPRLKEVENGSLQLCGFNYEIEE